MTTKTPPSDTTNRRTLILSVGIVVAAFAIAFQFVDPPPPGSFRLGTGSAEGAYHAWGTVLAKTLSEEGFDVELVLSDGSLENLERLRTGQVDLAFVQSGTVEPGDEEELKAIGAVAYEPLWVLQPTGRGELRLNSLRGARLHTGAGGSGTHALARDLLDLAGVRADEEGTAFLNVAPEEIPSQMRRGDLEAAFMVIDPSAPALHALLEAGAGDIELASLFQSEALSRHVSYLDHLVIPAGLVDLEHRIPPEPLDVVAATATLVAREDFHEALPPLLLERCSSLFGRAGLLAQRGHFPAAEPVDLELSDTAAHYLEYGRSFLHRVLPFRLASTLDRLKILLLPLLTLLIPLMRLGPPLLRWRHRSRIYRWYKDVRRIEGEVRGADTNEELARVSQELDGVEDEISQVAVPLSYHEELYNLRLHVGVVKRDITEAGRARKDDCG